MGLVPNMVNIYSLVYIIFVLKTYSENMIQGLFGVIN